MQEQSVWYQESSNWRKKGLALASPSFAAHRFHQMARPKCLSFRSSVALCNGIPVNDIEKRLNIVGTTILIV
jgi:hypothetical protein